MRQYLTTICQYKKDKTKNMGFLDKFKAPTKLIVDKENNNDTSSMQHEAFNTYRNRINIYDSLPYLDTQVGDDNYVHFYLDDNLLPNKFNQLYNSGAPIHAACINDTVDWVLGGGIEFEGFDTLSESDKQKVNMFKRRNDLIKLAWAIAYDYKIHNRINIKVNVYDGDLTTVCRVDPGDSRYNPSVTKFWTADDWYTSYNLCKYPLYTIDNKDIPGKYMIAYDGHIQGTKPYALPKWYTAFTDIVNAAEIPLFSRADMLNSINIGMVVSVPYIIENPMERQKYIKSFKDQKGSENNGNTVFFFGNGKENLPEITQMQTNENDKRFEVLDKRVTEQICYAHQMNPALLGVKTAGSLGMNQELKIEIGRFENTVVKPFRAHIEYVLNELVYICGLDPKIVKIKINDYSPIDVSLLTATTDKPKEEIKK